MGNDDNSIAIADLKARVNVLEREVEEIKSEQMSAKERAQDAALREKDLGQQMELLSRDIQAHLELHKNVDNKKMRGIDILLAIGMLLTAALSAYGTMAMLAVSKAVTK